MPIPATRRHAANLDLQTNQLLRACLESVTGSPTTFPALGRLAYRSNVGQERIILCTSAAGSGTWVNVPRLELAETVSGRWNFTSSGAPFTVTSATVVANLNAQLLQSYAPSLSMLADTLVVRDSFGSIYVQEATEPQHAVTLRQLEAAVKGRQDKGAVDAASTTSLPAHSATANTLTGTGFGALPPQDLVTLVVGNSLLVKNETAKARNGIYTVTTIGNAGASWVLTRRDDSDESEEVRVGLTTFVDGGTVNRNSVWTLIDANALPIVLGTTELTFSKTGGNTLYQDGNGLTLVGDTFHLGDGSSYTLGDLFVASDAANVSRIAAVTLGNVLRSGGVGALPTWGKVDLTVHVSGVVPVANGGTNSFAALVNGRVMISKGDKVVERTALTAGWLVVGDAADGMAPLGAGAPNRIVGINTSGLAHEHKAMTVTSAGVVTAGQWQATVIGAIYGGTGLTSWVAGDLLYASAANTLVALPWVSNGQFLKTVSGLPAWAAVTPADIGAISLTAHVSGILPVANGGTNSSTVLSNGRVMISSTGKLVERAALTAGILVIGDATNGVANLGGAVANQIVGVNNGSTAHEHKAMTVTAAGAVTAGTWQATVIGAIYGGTGQNTWVAGDLLYASGANTLSRRAVGSSGMFLRVDADTALPAWKAVVAADIGAISGSGTAGTLPKFTASGVLGNSLFSESGTLAVVNGRLWVAGTTAGHLQFTSQFNDSATVPVGGLGWQGTHLQFKPNASFAGGNVGYNLKRIALSHAVDLSAVNATAGLHSSLGQTMTVTHNLGTLDVVVAVRETTNTAEDVSVNWRAADANSVELFFDVVPPSGQYRIVVIG